MSVIRFSLNGQATVIPVKDSHKTLLQFLRTSQFKGTKEGCGDGDCGACTVAVVSCEDAKASYKAVNSCLIPLGAVANKQVLTVEGIGTPEALHPVQKAMVDTAGSQCGYCTPGFIMSMFAGYYSAELNDLTIEGNLCRCTGYLPIRKAIESLGKPAENDVFLQSLVANQKQAEERQDLADAHPFYKPQDLAELFGLMEALPSATLIAGGTDLGLELSSGSRVFDALISLEDVAELKLIKDSDEVLEIGAGVPLTHVEKALKGVFPALDEMLHWFAARQIRNRATMAGNIATASPIADLPPVLLALDASVKLQVKQDVRIVKLADFFTAYRQTVRMQDEVIVSILIPKALTEGATKRHSFSYKVGKRGTDDISIVAAAFTIDLDESNGIKHARLAYGGVAATPMRALEVETWLLAKAWTPETIQEAKVKLERAFTPLSDFRGSASYRNLLVANLFEKFFVQFSGGAQ